MKESFVFDIETGPLPEAELAGMLPVFNPDEVKLGNRKPETAAGYIEEKRKEFAARALERAALSPLTGAILAIGIMGPVSSEVEFLTGEEPAMIARFFRRFEDTQFLARWVGFNIAEFDLPFLVRRAWKLRLEIPANLFSRGYNRLSTDFVDLADVWRAGARDREIPSLDRLARFLGVGEKTASGSAFAGLLYGDRKTALEYLKNDLALTWKVAGALGVIRPATEPVSPVPARDPDAGFWEEVAGDNEAPYDDRKGFDPVREDPIRFE